MFVGDVKVIYEVQKITHCVPSAVILAPADPLAEPELNQLRRQIAVDLLSFSNFGYPADGNSAGKDTVWYDRDVEPENSFRYHCDLEGTDAIVIPLWVHIDDLTVGAYQQPQGLDPTTTALEYSMKRIKAIFDKSGGGIQDQPHRNKMMHETIPEVTFASPVHSTAPHSTHTYISSSPHFTPANFILLHLIPFLYVICYHRLQVGGRLTVTVSS
jgi:hypothetical protein